MAKEQKDQRTIDREAELERQQKVRDAIFDATHDKDGNPIPIVVPKTPQEG